MLAGLLKSVAQAQELRLAPGGAHERQAHGQALHRAHGHGEVGVAGHGGGRGEIDAGRVVAVYDVDAPGGAGGDAEDGVEAVGLQGGGQGGAGTGLGAGQGFEVGGRGQASGFFGHFQDFLLEKRHGLRRVGLVEGDDVGQRAHARAGRGQVAVQAVLELVEQHLKLGLRQRAGGFQHLHFDDGSALLAQHVQRRFQQRDGPGSAREVGFLDAQALAAQGVGGQQFSVVGVVGGAAAGGGVGGVFAHEGGQQQGGVAHGAGHGAGRVLGAGDGDDARPANQPHRGLEAHQAVARGRAHHRAVGFGAHGHGAQVGRHRRARPRAGAARRAVEHVGVAGLAAHGAPAAGAARGAEVGPLAEVGFAQDDGPGRP